MSQPFEPPPNLAQLMPYHQATKRLHRKQIGAWLGKFAQLMTAHPRFPATMTVTQQDEHTYLLTVTVDEPPALPT
ncbi:hypothetical protein JF780_05740 [Mycobacterium intracellulare]|uniref:hypothetical protein n=1 Tax=Mycobacterium intracellulare TaxID=1767 RepID=UPI001CD99D69|nr:hypothetical protein [Mycobacterium intracellulare]MCA2275493.1 hypothetical protein [Mycobacterium intracellulare]MCA2324453.1 hypothetical protein [Mycobacterium intracellulare]